jgi:hypothetical protein
MFQFSVAPQSIQGCAGVGVRKISIPAAPSASNPRLAEGALEIFGAASLLVTRCSAVPDVFPAMMG